MSEPNTDEQQWGRVLICGGINWATNGRKDRPANSAADLLSPVILRSLSNVKVTKLITGPSANYAVVLDIYGAAYIFGKPPSPSLASAPDGIISEHAPVKISPSSVGLTKGAKFVHGAAGRGHVLLVDSQGDVWGCGNNVVGQIGLPVTMLVHNFTKVTGPWSKNPESKVIQVTAGNTFSLFLTLTGQVYASGSSECGQLGNGKTGERLVKAGKLTYDVEVPPRLIQGFEKRKIVQIASGNQHSLALDEEGYVYAWGYAGYSRLGLQDQKDRLVPTIVPHFAGNNIATRAESILCGPTSSVVVDRQKMMLIAGKFKLTGDGSTGQPYTYFKYIQELMACKVLKASCGGCTHFLTTSAAGGGVMTVGFGQGCLYGELGLGPDLGKSATKPQVIEPLSGADVIDVAGGAFFSLFLAQPNAALSEIDRYPEHIESPSTCLACDEDRYNEDPMECERCDSPYHPDCLDPPLDGPPDGEWFCPACSIQADAGPDEPFEPISSNNQKVKNKNTEASPTLAERAITPKSSIVNSPKPESVRSNTPSNKRKASESVQGSAKKQR
ncbi:uncharacterized protein IL334_007190 [Kwoniella shivajii]|uniref:PHD-type domain-containing protein n=1 Tax=Kwoniella shivajii TaxID=564305 RepID=A0ABZ1D805_9TREE|nr:hypothetical protein IL334_007190 [Kwoniella shivajii]